MIKSNQLRAFLARDRSTWPTWSPTSASIRPSSASGEQLPLFGG